MILRVSSSRSHTANCGLRFFQIAVVYLNLSASATAAGLLIYKEQGFHNNHQARIVEYIEAKVAPRMVTARTRAGTVLDLPSGKVSAILPFPESSSARPESILRRIEDALAHFPQHKVRLDNLKEKWMNKIALLAEQDALEQERVRNIPLAPARRGEQPFRDGYIIKTSPIGGSLRTSAGVVFIRFADMTDEERTLVGYDPLEEATYLNAKKARMNLSSNRAADSSNKRLTPIPTPTPEEASMEAAPAPPEVELPSGTIPEFNGIPLSEIMADGIVATVRAPVYQLSGGDAPFSEAADRLSDLYPGPQNYSYIARAARNEAFQRLASDARPSKLIGHVRPGFILKSLNWKESESAAVFLPKSLGGARFAAVRWGDFVSIAHKSSRRWWNDANKHLVSVVPEASAGIEFVHYPATTNTLLLDPFEASDPIMSNTDLTMKSVWIMRPKDSDANSASQRAGFPLAVVETRDGLFLGYVSEKGQSDSLQITWEQAKTANARFTLKPGPPKELKSGSAILGLFDGNAKLQKRLPSENPADFMLSPEIYPEILNKGSWALKTSISVPKDAGFEPLELLETEASYQFELQKKLERIQLQFDGRSQSALRLLVVTEFNTREVSRSRGANGSESVSSTPWRRKTEILKSEVQLPPDGSILFTDGEKIYQVVEGRMGKTELIVYNIEENKLFR